jgi:hypothetical protein
VQRADGRQRLENHQIESALEHIGLFFIRHSNEV